MMPPAQVYFIAVGQSENQKTIQAKLTRLIAESRLLECIDRQDQVALKIHFGEEGNRGYVRPEYVRIINAAILNRKACSFLSDTNTLYRGKRTNSQEHRKLALAHGFTPDIVGTSLKIPDDTKGENIARIQIKGRFIKVAKVAKLFVQADALVAITHFKGHMMTGFGGALKNVGMGCASREGKLQQHCDLSPVIDRQSCLGCQACQKVCPVEAISMDGEKAYLDSGKCIGCASCIAACAYDAIDINWASGGEIIQEKMVEYAQAALAGKEKKRVFFNFALKITKECDCLAKDDPRIAPDIGILASTDPVAIDQASVDLVTAACGRDVFKQVHPKRNGAKQLAYAYKLGLGNLDYRLIEL